MSVLGQIEKLISIDRLIQQIGRKIGMFIEEDQNDEQLAEQKRMLMKLKDSSTSGDRDSRKTMREYIKSILITGFDLYSFDLFGNLSQNVEEQNFAFYPEDPNLDFVIPFSEIDKLLTEDKFGILLQVLSDDEIEGNSVGINNLLLVNEKLFVGAITEDNVDTLFHKINPKLTSFEKLDYIAQRTYEELYGLKRLDVLAYSDINEVGFSNDGEYVYCWVNRKIHLGFLKFNQDEARIIQERAISFDKNVGALNENNPEVLCHRFDGARVTVTQKPYFSARNCCIRIFNKNHLCFDDLVPDSKLKLFATSLVKTGQSMILQGGLGTGKSTFMSILYELLDKDLHVGLLEDMFELHIMNRYGKERRVVEAQRTVNKNLQNGVETFLRMSVDVAGLGEARSGEALFSFIQLVQSVSVAAWMTAQVNCPENTIPRLKNLLMGTGIYSDEVAAAVDIVHNINFILQNSIADGERYISEICEVVPSSELTRFGRQDFFNSDIESLQKEYYTQQLKKDISNLYSLNRIYDNRRGAAVFVNYPSQKFVDRASRFPQSEECLKKLLNAIKKDVGMDHDLKVWWE